jgi:DNA-binding transcriptional ArsR family regulator
MNAKRAGPKANADVFEAIAHPARRRIVQRLSRGPAPVHELVRGAGMTQQAVSKHLRVLSDAGVAIAERQGQENVYCLVPAQLMKVRAWLDSFWNEKLVALKTIAEEE